MSKDVQPFLCPQNLKKGNDIQAYLECKHLAAILV